MTFFKDKLFYVITIDVIPSKWKLTFWWIKEFNLNNLLYITMICRKEMGLVRGNWHSWGRYGYDYNRGIERGYYLAMALWPR